MRDLKIKMCPNTPRVASDNLDSVFLRAGKRLDDEEDHSAK